MQNAQRLRSERSENGKKSNTVKQAYTQLTENYVPIGVTGHKGSSSNNKKSATKMCSITKLHIVIIVLTRS